MKLLDEDIACREIPIRFKSLWSDAKQVWDIAYGLIQQGVLAPDAEPRLRWAVAGIHTKQLRLTRSVFLHLEHGLDQEAKMALRAMFELFLHLKFIHQSKDQFQAARAFLLWNHVNDAKIAGILSQQQLSKDRWKELRAELKPLVNKYQGEIEEIALNPFVRWLLRYRLCRFFLEKIGLDRVAAASKRWQAYVQYGPPMMNMDQLAKKFGHGPTYDHVYRDCSAVIHSYDAYFYVQPGDKTFTVAMAPSIMWTEELGRSALCFLVDTISIVDAVLSIGKQDAIQKLTKLSFCQPPPNPEK